MEYPKGEVVGGVSLLCVFTYHPVTLYHPSFQKEGSLRYSSCRFCTTPSTPTFIFHLSTFNFQLVSTSPVTLCHPLVEGDFRYSRLPTSDTHASTLQTLSPPYLHTTHKTPPSKLRTGLSKSFKSPLQEEKPLPNPLQKERELGMSANLSSPSGGVEGASILIQSPLPHPSSRRCWCCHCQGWWCRRLRWRLWRRWSAG